MASSRSHCRSSTSATDYLVKWDEPCLARPSYEHINGDRFSYFELLVDPNCDYLRAVMVDVKMAATIYKYGYITCADMQRLDVGDDDDQGNLSSKTSSQADPSTVLVNPLSSTKGKLEGASAGVVGGSFGDGEKNAVDPNSDAFLQNLASTGREGQK
ncbi:hypothetical protein L1987_20433 [Smallanthus sonchifolius]|uniref:Uncharacterized protein n=1 Tax=Smallanthus sonchifolius TaxID=185202 RepID=A0ACB9ITN9_9ASTR|nr:hypothetical protein L1987_20433 [Smallanthus sonchifolius]